MATDVTCLQCGKPFDASVVANRFAGVCPACLAKFAAVESEIEAGSDRSFKPPLKTGGTFRGMEVLELLGAGGMGVVYKARQPGLDRLVALKVLSPRLTGDAEFVARFNREAKAMAALNHPGIIQVFEFGQEADLCYLAMEYVDGVSLRHLMKERRLAPSEALKVVPKICEALEYAHSKGVIHRDIKPENILIDREGCVKIADFGLARVMAPEGAARVTVTNVVMGTPGYMAPEQYQSMSVDHRADIYSLGAVFYEMLTGELPVGRFDPPSSKVQIDVRLDEIVLKSLATQPDRRYQRAADVKTDVEACGAQTFYARVPTSPVNDFWMPVLLQLFLPALFLIAGVLVAGLGVSMTLFHYPGEDQSPPWALAGLIVIVVAVLGIWRWHVRWGRPTPPWRWRAALGAFGCGFASFAVHALLEMKGHGEPQNGLVAGLAILATYTALLILLEIRARRSASGSGLGDAHLPSEIRRPFRASTLAASSIAVVGLSYGFLFAALVAESSLRGYVPRTWQNIDFLVLVPIFGLVAAIGMASYAIDRREPRSGRFQAYAALYLALPPVGPIVAVFHLLTSERRMGRDSAVTPQASGRGARVHGMALAALILAGGGVGLLGAAMVFGGPVGCAMFLVGNLCVLVGCGLAIASYFLIRASQGRLMGRALAWAAMTAGLLALVGESIVLLSMPGDSPEARIDAHYRATKVLGSHLFLVTFERATAREGTGFDGDPVAHEVIPALQDPDTVGDAMKRATGWDPVDRAKLDALAALRAEFFPKAARVRTLDKTIDIPAFTLAFFVDDRGPGTSHGGPGITLGWKLIEEARRHWERRYLVIAGTQVLSGGSREEFRFDR